MIPHNKPSFSEEEISATSRVIKSNWVAQGQESELFENEICDYFEIPKGHAVVVSSGSAALYLALWSLEAKHKNVAFPSYSCTSLRNAIFFSGASPLYLDCNNSGPNFDYEFLNNNRCDILIAVSMFGIPSILPQNRNFLLIEDIAQSFGAKLDGVKIGLRGEFGVCSFSATKMFTSGGQGGAIVSRNRDLINKIKDFRNFDLRQDSLPRFNFQMSDLNASVGRCQLAKVDNFIKKRQIIYDIYSNFKLPLLDTIDNSDPVRYRAVLNYHNPLGLINHLGKNGIKSIVPITESELLCDSQYVPNALKLTRSTVSLPIYPDLSTEDAHKIAYITSIYINSL